MEQSSSGTPSCHAGKTVSIPESSPQILRPKERQHLWQQKTTGWLSGEEGETITQGKTLHRDLKINTKPVAANVDLLTKTAVKQVPVTKSNPTFGNSSENLSSRISLTRVQPALVHYLSARGWLGSSLLSPHLAASASEQHAQQRPVARGALLGATAAS